MRQKRYREAQAALIKATRLAPDYGNGFAALTKCYAEQGRYADVIAPGRKAVRLLSDLPSHCNLASALSALGHHDEALSLTARAVKRFPNEPMAHYQRAVGLLAAQRLEQALASVRRARELSSELRESYSLEGMLLRMLARGEEATELLIAAATRFPDDPKPRAELAAIFLEAGDRERAQSYAEEAVALAPEKAAPRLTLASILLRDATTLEEGVDAAVAALEVGEGALQQSLVPLLARVPRERIVPRLLALSRQSLNVDATSLLGQLHLSWEEWDAAIRCYDRLLQVKPEHSPHWTNKGLALMRAGRLEDAVAFFDEGLDRFPRQPFFHWNKGVCLIRLGEAEPALEALLQAHTLIDEGRLTERSGPHTRPEDVRALSFEGVLPGVVGRAVRPLLIEEEYEDAKALLERALKVCPDDPTLRSLLAECRRRIDEEGAP